MKITWLGQAGLLLETENTVIITDPYLSNSVAKIDLKSNRRCPVDESFLKVSPDVLIFTYAHLDHFDPESADVYLGMDGNMTVLAPRSVWSKARKRGNRLGGKKNYVRFDRGTQWTHGDIRFTSVDAA